jgi:hypothetical protein
MFEIDFYLLKEFFTWAQFTCCQSIQVTIPIMSILKFSVALAAVIFIDFVMYLLDYDGIDDGDGDDDKHTKYWCTLKFHSAKYVWVCAMKIHLYEF